MRIAGGGLGMAKVAVIYYSATGNVYRLARAVEEGAIVVPLGYTDQADFEAGGNPYGASSTGEPTEEELAVARYQGRRIAEKAAALALSRV